jgi:flagellar protein FliO/FliZ
MKWLLGLSLVSPAVWAATEVTPTTGLTQWLVSSFGVLALILVLAFLLKKSRLVPQIGRPDFKVLYTLPIGYKEKLVIVQAGEQQLLLGITPQKISFLQEIKPPLASTQDNSAFASHLARWMKKPSSPGDDHV